MVTNPDALTVLCFGDSNTYGQRSEQVELGRWPVDVRWTGQLQCLLGDEYSVIEEGLSGRTTNLDDPEQVGASGRAYLRPCLETHLPLDIVVLMLGTNDLKVRFERSSAQIVSAVSELVDDILTIVSSRDGSRSQVVLLAPVPPDNRKPKFAELYGADFDHQSIVNSQELVGGLRALALSRGLPFASLDDVADMGEDGLHLDRDSHGPVAELVARTIKGMGGGRYVEMPGGAEDIRVER
ncbi:MULTISPECIES: GDSL-type esterase/lipase family protein [unclassified Kitasatospora]|uniref:GDSL-type esterase/lipase family protein n=1 Tax=unclassified Kitasatospora TaxID=2633591 RepID=UPI0033DC690F